jgi:hypothetical protein
VRDPLIATMLELPSVVPYFDLSLQHAAPGLLRRMKRWGSGERFLSTIGDIRDREPEAAFRSRSSSGSPARRNPTTRRSSGSWPKRSSTGPDSLRFRPKTARPRPRWRAAFPIR